MIVVVFLPCTAPKDPSPAADSSTSSEKNHAKANPPYIYALFRGLAHAGGLPYPLSAAGPGFPG